MDSATARCYGNTLPRYLAKEYLTFYEELIVFKDFVKLMNNFVFNLLDFLVGEESVDRIDLNICYCIVGIFHIHFY